MQSINGDTRFFPGCGWVSMQPDCRLGLTARGATREEVIDAYLAHDRKKYWLRGRQVTLYVMMSPDDQPTEHHITI